MRKNIIFLVYKFLENWVFSIDEIKRLIIILKFYDNQMN